MYVCVYAHVQSTDVCTTFYFYTRLLPVPVAGRSNAENIFFLATTSKIHVPICTPHSLLEWRESGDHRGMYGVQIRVFFLVPDFAFIGVLFVTSFLFVDKFFQVLKICGFSI